VAVSNITPGKLKRLSVAVALSAEVMAKAKPADIEQIKQLVSATVGADATRGDQVAVAVRSFQPMKTEPTPFWEAPWFAMVVRNAVALLAVLLTLLLGVRPLIKALKRDPAAAGGKKSKDADGDDDDDDEEEDEESDDDAPVRVKATPMLKPAQDPVTGVINAEMLSHQVSLAQRLVTEKPDSALAALRQMLKESEEEPAA
jgi:flagellar M-ring protein FliF